MCSNYTFKNHKGFLYALYKHHYLELLEKQEYQKVSIEVVFCRCNGMLIQTDLFLEYNEGLLLLKVLNPSKSLLFLAVVF
jgi:hypothetical protein